MVVGLTDGRVVPISVDFPVSYVEDRRIVAYTAEVGEDVPLDTEGRPLVDVDWVEAGAAWWSWE